MHRFLIKMSFLAVVVLAAGCIKEDLSNCDNLTINLNYFADNAAKSDNVISKHVNSLDLYIIGADGYLMQVVKLDKGQLEKCSYAPGFRLAPGKYSFVALGNAGGKTMVSGIRTKSYTAGVFHHPDYNMNLEANTVKNGQDHNYIGAVTVDVKDGKEHNYGIIEMKSAHLNLSVEISGLQAPSDREKYSLFIKDCNAVVNFGNTVDRLQKTDTSFELAYNAENGLYHTSSSAIFRMDNNGVFAEDLCSHRVIIENGDGETMADIPVYKFIKDNNIDITGQEAVLALAIEFQGASATVTVPDWYIEDIEPDFGI